MAPSAPLLLLAVLCASALTTVPALTCGTTPLRLVRAPASWVAVDTWFDSFRGRLHASFGVADASAPGTGTAFYSFTDGGAWSAPAALSAQRVNLTGGERGPRLAAGPNGALSVAWTDAEGAPGGACARVARSTDGGATWAPPVAAVCLAGADGVSVAAGTYVVPMLVVALHAPNASRGGARTATYAMSLDGGATWAPPVAFAAPAAPPAAAGSRARARFDADTGRLYFSYAAATAAGGNTSVWLLTGNARGNDFSAVRVDGAAAGGGGRGAGGGGGGGDGSGSDGGGGPELTQDVRTHAADATNIVAFSRGAPGGSRVLFAAASAAPGSAFGAPVGTPAGEGGERWPTAVQARNGDALLLWSAPAANGSLAVHWACVPAGGNATAQGGSLGAAQQRPTALADGGEGGLLIVAGVA